MIAATPTLGIWMPTFSFGVTKQWLKLSNNKQIISMNSPIFYASIKNILKLPHNIILTGDITYTGKGYKQNHYINQNAFICNISVQKSLLKNALTIELRGNDLFREKKSSIIMYLNHLLGVQDGFFDSREFVLTLRYKFNMTPSKYKGTGAGAEQKSRF